MEYVEALTMLVTLLACMGPIFVLICSLPKNLKGWLVLFSLFSFFLFFFCDKYEYSSAFGILVLMSKHMMDLVFATNALNNVEEQFCPQTTNVVFRMTESNVKLLQASLDI